MRSFFLLLSLATIGTLGTSSSEELRLDRLKGLAGEWVQIGEDGKVTERVISSVRVTAGGNAVIETLFPGTEHEMITLYHEDGEDLVLAHFCVVGQHPRMRAEPGHGEKKLVFKCIGGFDMASEDEKHMHQGTIAWINENEIRTEWRMVEKGENVYTASYHLARKSPSRARNRTQ